jgi:hypothetical protein
MRADVAAMLAAEAKQLPLLPVAMLAAMFVAVLLSSLLSKTLTACGSVGYWLLQV